MPRAGGILRKTHADLVAVVATCPRAPAAPRRARAMPARRARRSRRSRAAARDRQADRAAPAHVDDELVGEPICHRPPARRLAGSLDGAALVAHVDQPSVRDAQRHRVAGHVLERRSSAVVGVSSSAPPSSDSRSRPRSRAVRRSAGTARLRARRARSARVHVPRPTTRDRRARAPSHPSCTARDPRRPPSRRPASASSG